MSSAGVTDGVSSAPVATSGKVSAVLAALVRIVLGVLWLHEGTVKYRAHFGRADILLVANSAGDNSRVPDFYQEFTATFLKGAPGLFGWGVPLLETALGIALIAGILSLPAALGSTFTLMSYWYADQLITQYPIMVLLSVVVVLVAGSAQRLSVSNLILSGVSRSRPAVGRLMDGSLRRWL